MTTQPSLTPADSWGAILRAAGRPGRAAVLGSPIDHSLSPELHAAGYKALGLEGWSYTRLETTADDVAARLTETPEDLVGYSVTMPGKAAALAAADVATERSRRVGVANTLVRLADGRWLADNTDVQGIAVPVRSVVDTPRRAVILGAGGTARPALVAASMAGVRAVSLASRSRERAAGALELAEHLGLETRWLPLPTDAGEGIDQSAPAALAHEAAQADVLISTLPGDAAALVAESAAACAVVMDVTYAPWPTTLAAAAHAAGRRVLSGRDMLVHQGIVQIGWFTGYDLEVPGSTEARRVAAAGAAAVGVDPTRSDAPRS